MEPINLQARTQARPWRRWLAVACMAVSCGWAPAQAQRADFDASGYNPAVLHVRFTSAEGRTTSDQTDAFLDLTLIPASGEVEGGSVLSCLQRIFDSCLDSCISSCRVLSPFVWRTHRPHPRQLYELMFGGLSEALQREKITTLLISADRGLQAVPFAALSDGQRFFGDRYAFAITPSLALMDFESLSTRQDRMLALGASEFKGLAELPLVPQEILRVGDPQKKDQFLNQEFTLDSLLDKGGESVTTNSTWLPMLNSSRVGQSRPSCTRVPDRSQ